MTGRHCLLNVLHRQPCDRLSWTTLVDDTTRSIMPAAVRQLAPFDFYRHLGCDILQFGNYGLDAGCAVPAAARRQTPGVMEQTTTDAAGVTTHTRATAGGSLVARAQHGHPLEYPVKTLAELRVLRELWEATTYDADPAHAAAFARTEQRIGEAGLYLPTLDASPVQWLLEYEMGVSHFYYLLADHRAELEELMAVMHRARLREYELVARHSPAVAVIPVENTSSAMISPALYRQYSLPQLRDYTDLLHAHGKQMVLHMCGHLKVLLPVIREVNADAFNATTPPPVGATYFEDVLDLYGDDFPLLGGIFPPQILHQASVTAAELQAALDRLYTPRIRHANLVLWLAADGLPTPLERFQAVQHWMEDRGRIRTPSELQLTGDAR